jgi:hypothetical protein
LFFKLGKKVDEVMYKTRSKFIQYGLDFDRGLKKDDKFEEALKKIEALKRKEHIPLKRGKRRRRR